MSAIAKAPWQVAFAACTAIVVGVSYAVSALLDIANAGDRGAIDERLAEYQALAGLGSASVSEVHEWMALAATVFAVVSAVFLLLGILLWQGALRPGVRLTLTITSLIAFAGTFAPLAEGLNQVSAVREETLIFLMVVHAVSVVGALLLWSPSVKRWITEPVD
jgi:hypothetical protein